MYQYIDNLSGKGFNLYYFWNNEGMLQVLVAAEEQYQFDKIVELLQPLSEMVNSSAKVEVYVKCYDLKTLHLLCGESERGRIEENVIPEMPEENKRNIGKQKNTAKQVMEYINAHFMDYNLTLNMIAQDMKITSAYLCTILKQVMGMSYKEYLTQLRIEEAKNLLEGEYISITEVCHRVGYINVSYFIKMFQKYTGVTPAIYRMKCCKNDVLRGGETYHGNDFVSVDRKQPVYDVVRFEDCCGKCGGN